jgi:endoribonuclease Dicer
VHYTLFVVLTRFQVDSVQLVFQQSAVLACNLDQRIESFCGDMGCDLWSKGLWDKYFAENMVIVCTAEVLRHCLHHSFIAMSRINLLIFDEAHHAKKDHPYARIIKDFYATEEDRTRRPRIFGMTASPVDTRTDIEKAAAELEALLHCEITTVSNPEVLQYGATLSRKEMILQYQPVNPPFETLLYRQMKEKLNDNDQFSSPLLFSKKASSELGAWCADQLWSFCLSEEEARKLESKTERKFRARKVDGPLQVFEGQISKLREARATIEAHSFQAPQPSLSHLSTKVMELMVFLRERYERPTDDKCIIFVKQRYTAMLLAKLFGYPSIGTPYLRVGNLVGPRLHVFSCIPLDNIPLLKADRELISVLGWYKRW